MTLVLEGPQPIPGGSVAAICRSDVAACRIGPGFGVTATKRPLLILIRQHGEVVALTPGGRAAPLSEAERLMPGAVERVARD